MIDIFYSGYKPYLFPHEQQADTIEAARAKSRTKYFWHIDGRYDYRGFDFNWLPEWSQLEQTHHHLLYSQFEQFQAIFAPKEDLPLIDNWHDRTYLARTTKIEYWRTLNHNLKWKLDSDWCPNPYDPDFIYVLSNKWGIPVLEYAVPGATEYKYVDDVIVTLTPSTVNWTIPEEVVQDSIDFSWVPHPKDPPYIYQFTNKWGYPVPGLQYNVAGATEFKCVSDINVVLKENLKNWTIPEEVVQDSIDFSWVPNPNDPPYIYHFGTEFQESVGLIYTVPGATELKFMGDPPTKEDSSKVIKAVDIFFVDMNNKAAADRFAFLQAKYPAVQKIRYINGWVETIKRCATRAATSKFWVISSENVYTDFNFEWHAEPWQNFMLHVFGSQWQKWADTFLINKHEFSRHSRWAKSLEEFPNLHFVQDQKVYRPDDLYDIYYVDHSNPESKHQLERIQQRYPNVKVTHYVDNYLDTLRRIMRTVETEYVWIINSVCDYSKFDFTWQPDLWKAKMLHVFPTDEQKLGDTFYVHVLSFKEQMHDIAILDWFSTVNYSTDQSVSRFPPEVVVYSQDSAVQAIKAHDFTGPYAFFKSDSVLAEIPSISPSLWRKKDRAVHVLSRSGNVVAIPRDAKPVLRNRVYDFPFIVTHPELYVSDDLLDIVYISNGECDAERWYNHLLRCTAKDDNSPKQTIHRVTGKLVRETLLAAAKVSTTKWFFVVTAKLEVDPNFDFSWQPDYLQEPRHYMFNAKNPLNGLEYCHQSCVAYNKNLVLATGDSGAAVTPKYDIIDVLSGVAHFNTDPQATWSTAFRECVKLKAATDNASRDRLSVWTTVAEGEHAEWSLRGANDAVEYYDSAARDPQSLMLSFERKWLDKYYAAKYP